MGSWVSASSIEESPLQEGEGDSWKLRNSCDLRVCFDKMRLCSLTDRTRIERSMRRARRWGGGGGGGDGEKTGDAGASV